MSEHTHPEIQVLRGQVAQLSHRVEDLELHLGLATAPPPPVPEPVVVTPPPPVVPVTPPPPPRPVPAPELTLPPVKHDPLVPAVDWAALAERLFTARTLAWAGGAATALGVILLFVMAASRGWVTPEMKVGLGLLVSLGLLGGAIELDRRKLRADSILAAAGAGIAGLYATLWAATSLYGFFGDAVALPLAAVVAAVAVAVAIRVKQQPLAVFGVGAAMLAPVLVTHHVTAGGVLFAVIMGAAALAIYWRERWEYLLGAAWLIAVGQALALLAVSQSHTGASAAVLGVELVAALSVAMLFAVELRKADRVSLSLLGWPLASSAFAVSVGGVFLLTGGRTFAGHSESGIGLMVLALIWAALAAVPTIARRPHADLTDILGAFSLTAIAAGTGLLLGGPALVCGWAAESLMLVAAAERITRRSLQRARRLNLASAVYLALAVIGTLTITTPTYDHLPALGAGSAAGLVALAGVALAGAGLCFGLRWIDRTLLGVLWLLPAAAVGYGVAWSLHAEWAVIAYAVLAAAVLAYRRTPYQLSWLPDVSLIVTGAALWAAGALVALIVTAPVSHLADLGWNGFGADQGIPGVVALLVSAVVLAWSLRRPVAAGADHLILLPVATLAYLIVQAIPAPYAIWAWLGVAAAAGIAMHLPAVRRRLGEEPLLAAAGSMLGLGLIAAWAYDGSLAAIADHGRTAGWESIAIAAVSALIVATAVRRPLLRSYALWLPVALVMQLAAMLLPGQYPLVAWAGISVAVSLLVAVWPRSLEARLVARPLLELATALAAGVTLLVLAVYETPAMLFETNHAPAAGLAAAAAATIALFMAAYAASRPAAGEQRVLAGHPLWKGLVYAGAAMALWTLAAGLVGGEQLRVSGSDLQAVKDGFQQGQVLVSISWVLVGLGLVVASLRGGNRPLRAAAIALLFVALGKLFLYDLAFLTAMARAVSFIFTGVVLLVAALLLQRFAPLRGENLGGRGPSHSGA